MRTYRVRVISRKAIREFSEKHQDATNVLQAWYMLTKKANWRNLPEVKAQFPSADLVGRRTVFNIGGNKYRLIARIDYRGQQVFIIYILTHKEYDKGDWK